MNSPAHDIALLLETLGHGTFGSSTGWCISAAQEPTAPATAITIYDTGGLGPDTDELDLHRSTFQVRVRSSSFEDAYAKQEAIRDALILTNPIEAASSLFSFIVMTTSILSLGRDGDDHHLLVASYRCQRTIKET